MTTPSPPLRPQGDTAPPWYRQRWPWLLTFLYCYQKHKKDMKKGLSS